MPIRDRNPIGISVEFFEFPAYMGFANTPTCLANLENALGSPASVRIGGLSQDHATFEPGLLQAIKYNPVTGKTLPDKLSFGPQFIQLAATLKGPITIGFNRRSGDLDNTILAVTETIRKIPNIYSVELGNEPDGYGSAPPIARSRPWGPVADVKSQLEWQERVSKAVRRSELVQAGVYLQPPRWSIANLAPQEGDAAQYVKSFGGHAYQQSGCPGAKSSLPALMLHHNIARFVKRFEPELAAAQKLHKPYHFSETNSANCQGAKISSTFGAGLWLMDYTIEALMLGVHRLYFHLATPYSTYNLWDKSKVFGSYYGAYFTALALRKATHMTRLDNDRFNHPVYAFYHGDKLIQLLLYNSVYYGQVRAQRPRASYIISGLPKGASKAEALYLTAPTAETEQTGEDGPTVGGASFDDATCKLSAPLKPASIAIKNGRLDVVVADSQAALITLPEFSTVDGSVKDPPAYQ